MMRIRGEIDWVKAITWLVAIIVCLWLFWQFLSWIDVSFGGRVE